MNYIENTNKQNDYKLFINLSSGPLAEKKLTKAEKNNIPASIINYMKESFILTPFEKLTNHSCVYIIGNHCKGNPFVTNDSNLGLRAASIVRFIAKNAPHLVNSEDKEQILRVKVLGTNSGVQDENGNQSFAETLSKSLDEQGIQGIVYAKKGHFDDQQNLSEEKISFRTVNSNTQINHSSRKKSKEEFKKWRLHKSYANISFKEAEKLLKDAPDGSWLTRPSASKPGDITITYKTKTGIINCHLIEYGLTINKIESIFENFPMLSVSWIKKRQDWDKLDVYQCKNALEAKGLFKELIRIQKKLVLRENRPTPSLIYKDSKGIYSLLILQENVFIKKVDIEKRNISVQKAKEKYNI